MGYVAVIGLMFVPLLLLLLCAWNYVRYRAAINEKKPEAAGAYKKTATILLICAGVAAVVFGVLRIVFPITA